MPPLTPGSSPAPPPAADPVSDTRPADADATPQAADSVSGIADGVPRLADVVPAPVAIRPDPDGGYKLTADTAIHTTADPAARAVGHQLADLLRPATGYPLPVTDAKAGQVSGITLLLDTDTDTAEGYRLVAGSDGVVIRARTGAGLFYGVQTLRQLLPAAVESREERPGPWPVPGGVIEDAPRFAYRGAMLDVARHFFGVPEVLRFIDHIARYKINHLHLHLTDDQGWRIAIDAYPRLAEIGGATEVDGGPGGYYTAAQYRRIVDYAAERHITVVPEIDLPGHTNAALTAYGELAPDGIAPPPYTGTDVGFSSVAVERESTYTFLAEVLAEVAALTPGPYLHIGGDEAFTLGPVEYAAFMERLQPLVAATGKTVVGWHQLAVAGHSPGRVIQYWGTGTADASVTEAVRRGAKVLLSPGNRTYLDMKYTPATPLGKDWAGLIEVSTAYGWDPGSYLEGVPGEAVLGVEAPLWTETVESMADIEFMTFPRLPAIAELGWSAESSRDWPDFRQRLAAQGARWEAAGITHHRSPEIPWLGTSTPAQTQVPS
nr:beta-N-acetylhexosaminidase [Micromonospora sp. DSM 115978]